MRGPVRESSAFCRGPARFWACTHRLGTPPPIRAAKAAPVRMTVRELARAVIAGQGVTDPDLKLLRTIEGGLRACLNNNDGKTVESVRGAMPARW